MENITDVHITSLKQSKYLTAHSLHYVQSEKKKVCDCVTEHSDVSILLFNSSRNVFIFVKQFRPAVYLYNSSTEVLGENEVVNTLRHPGSLGVTIELCAGLVDRDEPLADIARAEVLEECGYLVPEGSLRKITSCRNGSSITGALVTLFYAQVTDEMKVSQGGGLEEEGELIEVVELPVGQALDLIYDESVNREATLLLALQWFFSEIWPVLKKTNISGNLL
ncbi:uridine diphosphate glucose pyrophosphatase NUDT14-like [Physella acuta]|uniref:uridine diphosphate glucose pyrophosphatase NUDT14-like n=1 Tax=Physella acuta TaxID=109671 RepID=UPI0027DD2C88|nr:uridine diphosphate glucose pyrophosphatase NUDT14-like [Physella acuta]XP_059164257.1 uridine diphosphate glucose pyrophosphatase NUDT14-like [Physella acuta]XP_059164258.1 uridine diphosphate glucose pyrophosphatase NUDT14-like [Physella acuta]XP_059164259.1 uridine diphosphate glucose pyrophosphatase NUDT14-like [Physella acuta]XP_059164260.1 uridine diphosphate glucose pyrophosphatase NUDT14-like [Physella acuta]XP_059164261.1 uridine diphosphate glucose pyrophosphatase NUDT14-like [Phy